MRAVRIEVKLTNAVDEGMVRRGHLAPDRVRTYTAAARVDIGALVTVLPTQVAQHLGLAIVRREQIVLANGTQQDAEVTEAVGIEVAGRRTTEETCVLGDEVLIGQTFLARTDLHVDEEGDRLIGNPAHPDQPVLRVK